MEFKLNVAQKEKTEMKKEAECFTTEHAIVKLVF